MNTAKLTWNDGTTTYNDFNGTKQDAKKYWENQIFNVGKGVQDKMLKCIKVKVQK